MLINKTKIKCTNFLKKLPSSQKKKKSEQPFIHKNIVKAGQQQHQCSQLLRRQRQNNLAKISKRKQEHTSGMTQVVKCSLSCISPCLIPQYYQVFKKGKQIHSSKPSHKGLEEYTSSG
jgi:hypothetical protein